MFSGGVALRCNTSHKIQLVTRLGFHFCVLYTQKTLYLGAYAPGAVASFQLATAPFGIFYIDITKKLKDLQWKLRINYCTNEKIMV